MRFFLPLLTLAVIVQGCVSYPVRFNGYLSPQAAQNAILTPEQTFYITEEENAKNLLFSTEIRDKIGGLLQGKGYRPVTRERAAFFLTYNYSITPGIVSGIRPETQPPGTGTINTFTENGKTRTSYVTFPGYTVYVPYRYTVYTAILQVQALDARDARSTKDNRPLWIGESSLTSQNPDLRELINYLLVETFAHFGENTRKSIKHSISSKDPRVQELLK